METQICTKCKQEKPLTDFYKGNNKLRLTYKCKSCYKEYKKTFNKNNPSYFKNYVSENKEQVRKHKQKYYKNNIDKCRKAASKYQASEKGRKQRNKQVKNRRKKDSLFKLKKNIRTRIWSVFKNHKTKETEELLGCTFEEAKLHLESTFQEGMTWENYGEWHIDHKIPLASTDSVEEIEKLCHYTNLQALWAFDNLSKGSKILTEI